MLKYIGLQPVTTLDFPGRLAATIFTAGCPLRCPYCHNPELVEDKVPPHFIPVTELFEYLEKRKTMLSGVAITGGEPLLHTDLPDLLNQIAELGFEIKLDTSGVLPKALKKVLSLPAISYVAMDVKTLPKFYSRVMPGQDLQVSGLPKGGELMLESMGILRDWAAAQAGRQLEFRTTCAPKVVEQDDLFAMIELFQPDDVWTLVQFRPGGCLDPAMDKLVAYDRPFFEKLKKCAEDRGIKAGLRGLI
ncbi:MAG: anaerobic ribonucleoside-triphosphate reductase activating protein [Spirochaetaceae bacterium]|nr:MAG: anaerobic ribonucleoside-triphosphate reductase activating protein [Spirochaetaceae bacterium]